MKKSISGAIIALLGVLMVLMTACSGGGDASNSSGPAGAHIMSPKNQLDGYTYGKYRDPSYAWIQCKDGSDPVSIDDSQMTKERNEGEMSIHFNDSVPEFVAVVKSDGFTYVYRLNGGAKDYVLDLSYVGVDMRFGTANWSDRDYDDYVTCW